MAAGASYKALAIAKNLQSDLNQRAGSALWSLSTDPADGYPVLTLGSLASDAQTALIKINTQLSSTIKDSLGLQQTAFSPHVAQLVLESTTAGLTGAALTVLNVGNMVTIMADVASFVNRMEVYLHAHGTAISLSDITGVPAQKFQTQIQYPGTGDV
jgi:tRNA(Met) C34 N-acetyltransferase TmcA